MDTSDPALRAAVADVRDDHTETTWVILGYQGKDKLVVKDTGTGGVEDLAEELDEGSVSFALLRVVGASEAASSLDAQVDFLLNADGPTLSGVAVSGLVGVSPRRRGELVAQQLARPHQTPVDARRGLDTDEARQERVDVDVEHLALAGGDEQDL